VNRLAMTEVPTRAADDTVEGLAAEVLVRFGEVRLRVMGSSMLPSVQPGDVLTIQRCVMSVVESGAIVLFTREGRLFAHRVVARRNTHLVTRGDALEWQDPPVRQDQLLGRVVTVTRNGRRRQPPSLTIGRRIAAAVVRRSARARWLLVAGARVRRPGVYA
jgi:Peptidase S24-like